MKKSILLSVTISVCLLKLSAQAPIIKTIAGNGTAGYSGDGGPATDAQMNQPTDIAVDGKGDVYIMDNTNNVIRMVNSSGIISTIAGIAGTAGYTGDGGPATSATLNSPWSIAFDGTGNLYIADVGNNVIRKINRFNVISTVAGTGMAGYSGDGGPAIAATLNGCSGIAVDGLGNLYIADDNNNVIRKVNAVTGIISTIVGNGTQGYSGDGGPALSAQLSFPVNLTVDANGNIYVADNVNSVVRKVDSSNVITTVAGTGVAGYNGDGIAATTAQLYNDFDVAVDPSGNVYIADWFNSRIRLINTAGIISTYAGNGTFGYSGDCGPATAAQLNGPTGVTLDASGNLYIADWFNNVVRKVAPSFSDCGNTNTSCISSTNLGALYDTTKRVSPLIQTSSEGWYSFTAETKSVLFNIQNTNLNSWKIVKSSLYQGNCNSLAQIYTDSLSSDTDVYVGAVFNNLVIGNTYYLKLTKGSSQNCQACLGNNTASFNLRTQGTAIAQIYCNTWTVDMAAHELDDLETPLEDGQDHTVWQRIIYDPNGNGNPVSDLPDNDNIEFWMQVAAAENPTMWATFDNQSSNVVQSGYTHTLGESGGLKTFLSSSAQAALSEPKRFIFLVQNFVDVAQNIPNPTPYDQWFVFVDYLALPTVTPPSVVCLNQTSVEMCLTNNNDNSVNPNPYNYAWSVYWTTSLNPNQLQPIQHANGVFCNTSIPIDPNNTHQTIIYSHYGFTNTNPLHPTCITFDSQNFIATPLSHSGLGISITADNVNDCLGQPFTLTAHSASPDPVTYNWSPSTGLNSTAGNTVSFNPNAVGTYVITATGLDQTTQCSDQANITVHTFNPPVAQIQTNDPYIWQCNIQQQQTFSAVNTGNYKYTWSISPSGTGAYLLDGNGHPVNSFIGQSVIVNVQAATMDFQLCLVAEDPLTGCSSESTCLPIKKCCDNLTNPGFSQISSLSQNINGGNYIITGQVNANQVTNISNANFIMNPGSYIALADDLTIDKTHFYACSDMWDGFMFVNYGNSGNQNPTLTITNSLIEDATYGINIANPIDIISTHPNDASQHPNINLNNVWFNRCAVGIANDFDPLNIYNPGVSNFSYSASQFQVANCVFTCRDGISMANNVIPHNTSGWSLFSPPPSHLHNFNFNPGYTSFTGIASGAINSVNTSFQGCFFDALTDGILSAGALSVQNNIFQFNFLNPSSPNYTQINTGNYGISSLNGPTYLISKAGTGVNFYGGQLTVSNSNAFYFSNYGIIASPDGTGSVSISNNTFRSTTYSGVYINFGSGIISGNNFHDHFRQGINVYGGTFLISSNTFSVSPSFYSNNNPAYNILPEAISVNGGGGNKIASNTINNYQLGISAISSGGINISNNTILMFEDNSGLNPFWFTHGISTIKCFGAVINQNDISSTNIISGFKYGQFGVFTENSNNSTITCNHINYPDVALKCQGSNNTSSIVENTLQNAAIVSFWLDQAGYVGPQGHAGSGSAGFTNANKFVNVGQYATYANNGSNGQNSPFYYRNTGIYKPIPSGSDNPPNPLSQPIPTGTPYALNQFASSPRPCPIITLQAQSPILANGTAHSIALNALHFSQFDTTAGFGNKLDLYRTLINQGPTLYGGDPTLTSFMNNMTGSSQAQLVYVDTLLMNADNDTSKVNTALLANNSLAPGDNYDLYMQKFNNLYGLYLKQKRNLNASQIQQIKNIAQLCPYEYGEGVYRSRALLTRFDTVHYFNVCEQGSVILSSNARVFMPNEEGEISQRNIIVYPNPASNYLSIEGLEVHPTDKVEFSICNNLGELVFKANLFAHESLSYVKVDLTRIMNGAYVYKIIVNDVVVQFDKLVIVK
jgi:hypothetical protein